MAAGRYFSIFYTLFLIWHSTDALKEPGCGYTPLEINVQFQTEGVLQSPGFDDGLYQNNVFCEYVLRSSSATIIKIEFDTIDIEPDEKCSRDSVRIRNGTDDRSGLLAVFCGYGYQTPGPIYSASNGVRIIFTTDYMVGGKGFRLRYKAIRKEEKCPTGSSLCKNNKCYSSDQRCDGNDDCGDGTDEEKCSLPLPSITCGVTPINPLASTFSSDRIIGGQEVRIGSWPWQADLQAIGYYPNAHICGGTLINAQWVLTAVHCLQGRIEPQDWRIHLGNHHKFKTDKHEQVRFVERLVIYPGYTDDEIGKKPISMEHDIALMKLNAPVKFTDYVRPACLPAQSYEVPARTLCYGTGWGTTRGSGHNDVLKQVDLSIRYAHECTGYFVNKTMVCVKNDRGYQDICHGDSGGPLACKLGNLWYVLGITSFHTESNLLSGLCGLAKSGAVYNKVSAKTEWINDMIQRFS